MLSQMVVSPPRRSGPANKPRYAIGDIITYPINSATDGTDTRVSEALAMIVSIASRLGMTLLKQLYERAGVLGQGRGVQSDLPSSWTTVCNALVAMRRGCSPPALLLLLRRIHRFRDAFDGRNR